MQCRSCGRDNREASVDRSIKLADHATVRTLTARDGVGPYNTEELDSDWPRAVALEAGADDVGFVSLDDPAVAGERDYVREALPGAQSLVAICLRSNREIMRSVARSVASRELYAARDHVDLWSRAFMADPSSVVFRGE